MALELKEESIELLGSDILCGFQSFNIFDWDWMERATGVGWYWVSQLDDFIKMAVGHFQVVKFSLKGSDRVKHQTILLLYEC